MKRLLLALSILVLIGAIAAAVLWQQYSGFRDTALDLPEDGLVIMLEPGESYPDLVRKLSRLGVTRADWRWRLFGRLTPAVASMKAGEYRLVNLTPVSLIDLLVSGKTMQHSLTVVEGWSLRELLTALSENEILIQTIDEPDPGLLASDLSARLSARRRAVSARNLPVSARNP